MSIDKICIDAPAKVNFGLRVLPAREDGFHNIESIFQMVSLRDRLEITRRAERGCTVLCNNFTLPLANTITAAYRAFETAVSGAVCGVTVLLSKCIPAGSGLGGGSSDAAALVRGLSALCGICLTEEQKKAIAAQVGSDVFFFLEAGQTGCAVVSGRGEVVHPIEPRADVYLLLVFPEVHSGTAEAYRLVDSYIASQTVSYPGLDELEGMYRKSVAEWTFVNTFTDPISGRYPRIAEALADVRLSGARYSEMSGSGSTVYGAYASREEAEAARRLLDGHWQGCTVVRPCRMGE